MSNISTIVDAIISQVGTALTGKTVIPNPYSLTDNPVQLLENAYGVAVRGSGKSLINTICSYSFEQRTFEIILSRRVFRLENDYSNFTTAIKNLMEDAVTVKNTMLAFTQLGIDDNIEIVEYVSDTGIEFVLGDNFALMYTTISFTIDYRI